MRMTASMCVSAEVAYSSGNVRTGVDCGIVQQTKRFLEALDVDRFVSLRIVSGLIRCLRYSKFLLIIQRDWAGVVLYFQFEILKQGCDVLRLVNKDAQRCSFDLDSQAIVHLS